MKKKILSSEALGTLLKKAESTAPDEELNTQAAATEGGELDSNGGNEGEANAQAEGEDLETNVEAEVVTQLQTEIDGLKVQLTESEESLVDMKATHEQNLLDKEAEASPLKKIVSEQITTMRVGLSLADVDLSNYTAKQLVAEYDSVATMFMKTIKPGPIVPEGEGEVKSTKPLLTSHDMSAINALGIKPN